MAAKEKNRAKTLACSQHARQLNLESSSRQNLRRVFGSSVAVIRPMVTQACEGGLGLGRNFDNRGFDHSHVSRKRQPATCMDLNAL